MFLWSDNILSVISIIFKLFVTMYELELHKCCSHSWKCVLQLLNAEFHIMSIMSNLFILLFILTRNLFLYTCSFGFWESGVLKSSTMLCNLFIYPFSSIDYCLAHFKLSYSVHKDLEKLHFHATLYISYFLFSETASPMDKVLYHDTTPIFFLKYLSLPVSPILCCFKNYDCDSSPKSVCSGQCTHTPSYQHCFAPALFPFKIVI